MSISALYTHLHLQRTIHRRRRRARCPGYPRTR